MNEEKLMELAGLLDDDLIVRAAGTVGRKERPMKKRTALKAAVLAACVCLALVGTAFAANALYGIFQVNNGDGTVTRTFTVKLFGEDQVSEEARQAMAECAENMVRADPESEESPLVKKIMGSWQELQEYTGVDLADSALLDGAEPADYRRNVCYTVIFDSDGMNFERSHVVDDVTVNLYAGVLMSEDGTEGVRSDAHTMGVDGNSTYYTLSDGTMVYYWTNEYDTHGYPVREYYAYFVHDGIEYTLITNDTQLDRAYYAGEMEAGGLHLEDPHADYEGVFLRVLDSFVFD